MSLDICLEENRSAVDFTNQKVVNSLHANTLHPFEYESQVEIKRSINFRP